jgi:arylsulfatase A-like enzyme/Tfp pilus assembly protein PilF
MTARVRLLVFSAVGLALAGGGWWLLRDHTSSSTRPSHVVIFTLDTTRADRLGAYGWTRARTPHLDNLAARGVRFDDAVTVAPITGPAHAAIFTGQYPARHGVRDNATTPLPDRAETLAESLAAAGFATGGFIGAFVLDRAYGFAQGFSTFGGFTRVESGREANAERVGAEVVDEALRWVATIPVDQRLFLWVHLYDPHAPYAPPPSAATSGGDGYDDEVAYMDGQIGRVLQALEARGTLADTLVMAVADHGESLGEHGEDEHGVFLYEPVLRVPWIIAGPGVPAARVVSEQVRVIDVVPTVLDALGLPSASDLDGETLWPVVTGGARAIVPAAYAESYYPKLHYGWSELRALRADGWKVIDAPTAELYALGRDRQEATNLYAGQQSLADRMIAEARRLEEGMTGGTQPEAATPDRDTLERLRSLGYIGSAAPLPKGERGPDPKDRIEERRQFKVLMSAAIDDLGAGRIDAAISALRQLVATNERVYDLHQLLGEAYGRQGRVREALGEYDMAALLNTRTPAPHLSAAELLLRAGQVREARVRVDRASAIDGTSFDVAFVRAQVLDAEGRTEDAISEYERAIAINPANPRPRMLLVGVASRVQRFAVAERELQALLAMQFQPSRTHFALGQLAQMQGRRAEAATHYEQALRIEPGLTIAAQALAQVR